MQKIDGKLLLDVTCIGVLIISALGDRGSNSHILLSFGLSAGVKIGAEGREGSSECSFGNSCPNLLEGLPILICAANS